MEIKINFTNRWLYSLIAFAILIVLAIGVYAISYNSVPNPGHGADSIVVNTTSGEKTLQQAIDDGLLGGGTGLGTLTNYEWQGIENGDIADYDGDIINETKEHLACFLIKNQAHDDNKDARRQGCAVLPNANLNEGPITWQLKAWSQGNGVARCKAICIG